MNGIKQIKLYSPVIIFMMIVGMLLSDARVCGFDLNSVIYTNVKNTEILIVPAYKGPDSLIYYSYIPVGGVDNYLELSQTVETYDIENRLIERINRISEYDEYLNDKRMIRKYDPGGYLSYEVNFLWNDQLNYWDSTNKDLLVYENNLLKEEKFRKRIGGYDTLMLIDYLANTYDIYDTLRQTLIRERDTISLEWKNKELTSFSYIDSENKKIITIQIWDETELMWLNQYRITEVYNMNDQLTLSTVETWNKNSLLWKNTKQIRYQYESVNQVDTIDISYYYDEWELDFRILFEYVNNQHTFTGYYFMDVIEGDLIINEKTEYQYENGLWWNTKISQKDETGSFWNEQFIHTTEKKEPVNPTENSNLNIRDEEVIIYPNPVNNRIYLINNFQSKICNVQIFNTQGIELINQRYVNNFIDLSGFSGGIYIVKIVFENGYIWRNSIIKQNR